MENVVEDIVEENASLSEALTSIQRELSALSNAASITIDTTKNVCFTTKTGDRMYSPAIRKLYYTLLADQIPPAKICSTIKSVLKTFPA